MQVRAFIGTTAVNYTIGAANKLHRGRNCRRIQSDLIRSHHKLCSAGKMKTLVPNCWHTQLKTLNPSLVLQR